MGSPAQVPPEEFGTSPSVAEIREALAMELPTFTVTPQRVLRMVIRAARGGRYCHGNGVQYFFATGPNLVVANVIKGEFTLYTREQSRKYMEHTPPHYAIGVAENLELFLSNNY